MPCVYPTQIFCCSIFYSLNINEVKMVILSGMNRKVFMGC